MNHRTPSPALRLGLFLAVAAGGCARNQPSAGTPEPPAIPVSKPVQRQVSDYVDFTGRTDAIQAVDVRARVTGFLVNIPFKEGAEVKKGELLFEIDPRPYKAQLDQANSQVDLYEASLRLARTTLERDKALLQSAPGSVSRQQIDQDQAAVEEAEARVKAFREQVQPAFARVLSEGEEPADAATRKKVAALWRAFAEGLKTGR